MRYTACNFSPNSKPQKIKWMITIPLLTRIEGMISDKINKGQKTKPNKKKKFFIEIKWLCS